jgi:hypothetical protein
MISAWKKLKPIGRSFSIPSTSTLTPNHSIYVSKSTDPYFNLSLEDWSVLLSISDSLTVHIACRKVIQIQTLRRTASLDLSGYAMCRNWPQPKSMDGGKYTSSAQSADTAHSSSQRRRNGLPCTFLVSVDLSSGSFPVWQDLGNTNFSIHLTRTTFDRHVTTQMVVRAVRACGVDAYANERNDICVDGKKISRRATFESPALKRLVFTFRDQRTSLSTSGLITTVPCSFRRVSTIWVIYCTRTRSASLGPPSPKIQVFSLGEHGHARSGVRPFTRL